MPSAAPSTNPVIFISAGEASGEHYGALLAAALQQELARKGERAELIGMGGPRMAAAGVECIVRAEDMAVMGFSEVVLHLPRIYGEFQKLKRAIRARRPSVAVLIDFPEIHFRLAKLFHELGIPVIYFVSPQLWAWKQHRIRLVRKYVRRMLVIFPFEEPFYRERGIAAEFVGHPLAELPPPAVTREQFAVENDLNPACTWIALLPGSRLTEARDHLPTMLQASRDLPETAPGYDFMLPLAPTLDAAQRAAVARIVEQHGAGLTVRLVPDARAALLHARASVVASGTATVEAALMGNPFVVVYHVSPVTYAIAKRVVKVPHVAMVNLIAGKRVVPELIQHDFTEANIVQQLMRLLPDGPARESMNVELGAIQSMLRAPAADQSVARPGAIARVAEVVLEELEAGSPAALAAAQH
jgi:lipid-A-disaccharide synthase